MDNAEHLTKPTVLVVDDTPDNLTLMSAVLKDLYKVKVANSGERGLAIAQSVPPPDIVLLDVMMPEMDGHEVMRRLQANASTRDIPVIFVTAVTDMDSELAGFELGAVDYITKPFNPPVVRARVHTHLALQDAKRRLAQQNAQLLSEREMIEDIIMRMRTSGGFDPRHLRILMASVDRTNGDVLLSAFTPDGRQWVLVGDFTGHGLPAAVAAPLVSYVFYNEAQRQSSAEAVLETINAVLYRQLPINVFMAGCLIEVSADRSQVKLWNCGLPSAVLVRQGKISQRFDSSNTPLGLTDAFDAASGCATFQSERDDRLYVSSDGAMETSNGHGEMFGTERLEKFLMTHASSGGELDELLRLLEQFRGGTDFPDDITLIEIGL